MSNQQNFQNQQTGEVGFENESRHHKMHQPGVDANITNPNEAYPYGGAHPYGAGTYGVPGMYPYGHQLHGYGVSPYGYGYGHYYHPYGFHHHHGWHHPGYGYGYPNYPQGAVGYGQYPYGPREFSNFNYQQPPTNTQVQESSFTQGNEGFPYQVNPEVPYTPYGQPQFAINPYQGFNRPQQQPGQVIQGTSTPVRKERKNTASN